MKISAVLFAKEVFSHPKKIMNGIFNKNIFEITIQMNVAKGSIRRDNYAVRGSHFAIFFENSNGTEHFHSLLSRLVANR